MPRYIVQVPGKKFGEVIASPGQDVTEHLAGNVHAIRSLLAAGWIQVLPDPPTGEVVPVPSPAAAAPAPSAGRPEPPQPEPEPQEEPEDGRTEAAQPERAERARRGGRGG